MNVEVAVIGMEGMSEHEAHGMVTGITLRFRRPYRVLGWGLHDSEKIALFSQNVQVEEFRDLREAVRRGRQLALGHTVHRFKIVDRRSRSPVYDTDDVRVTEDTRLRLVLGSGPRVPRTEERRFILDTLVWDLYAGPKARGKRG